MVALTLVVAVLLIGAYFVLRDLIGARNAAIVAVVVFVLWLFVGVPRR